jgi:hypothetical protein
MFVRREGMVDRSNVLLDVRTLLVRERQPHD